MSGRDGGGKLRADGWDSSGAVREVNEGRK